MLLSRPRIGITLGGIDFLHLEIFSAAQQHFEVTKNHAKGMDSDRHQKKGN
jgi:hypothetical protein